MKHQSLTMVFGGEGGAMAHLTRTHLVAAFVFVLVLGSQSLAAQSGKGSGSINSPSTQTIVLTGNVVMADGSPPKEPVAIERVCATNAVRLGYTDAKGLFSFQLAYTPLEVQDASERGADTYTAPQVTANASGFGIQPIGPPTVTGSLRSSGSEFSTVAGCNLRASLTGFHSTSVMILTSGTLETTHVGTIVLLSVQKQGATVSATSMNVPKGAKKAYEKGFAELQKHNFASAQAHLERAVKLYPQYVVAWTELGWVHEQQDHLEEAQVAFTKARDGDDKFVPAYVGLASVALRQSKWPEAQELSARAIQLDYIDFPTAFYYNAVATFQLRQLDQAEKSARMAEQLDTRQALPQARLLLGSILAAKQNYAEAADQLRIYLKMVPRARNAEKVQQRLIELEKLSTSAGPSPTKDADSPVSVNRPAEGQVGQALTNWREIGGAVGKSDLPGLAFPQNWAPPDIDQVVPPVRPGVSCPLKDVVSGVSARAKELMANLQQFSATERIEQVEMDKAGNPRERTSATFKYVAEIWEGRTGVAVNEYRDGSSFSAPLANVATIGVAAHALMFHPSIIDDLAITCEGLGSVQGTPAWQLHFAQQSGRPPRFRYFVTPQGRFPVELKGRAWVAVDSHQVIRMETDLARPINEIALQKDHLTIDYRPLEFSKRKVQLWLPQTTDLYLDFAGKRIRRQHSFGDFELFWVDVAEKARDPEVR